MSIFVPLFLFGWPLVVLALFATMGPTRAVVVSLVAGWLFLPVAGYALPGLPDYTKITATSLSLLAGILLFDSRRISRIPRHWMVLPGIVWVLMSCVSAILNGFGPYDAASTMFVQFLRWGVPFMVGLMYFGSRDGMERLAIGLVAGALAYLPLVLYELRMAPVLHHVVFGFTQHQFVQTVRWGGWRPMVFLDHGLALALWYSCAAAAATTFALYRPEVRIFGIPVRWVAVGVIFTSVACKSLGALVMMAGAMLLVPIARTRWFRPAIVGCVLIVPVYLGARIFLDWRMEPVISVVGLVAGESRAESLETRIRSEAAFSEHAKGRILVGWSGWGRMRDLDESVQGTVITDSLWILAFGQYGLIGLAAFFGMFLVGCLRSSRLVAEVPRSDRSGLAGVVGCILVTLIVVGDSLFNAMPNPVWTAAAGGLTAFAANSWRASLVTRAAGAAVVRSIDRPRAVAALDGRQGGGS